MFKLRFNFWITIKPNINPLFYARINTYDDDKEKENLLKQSYNTITIQKAIQQYSDPRS